MTAVTSNPVVCVVDASVWVSAFVSSDVNYAASLAWLRTQSAGGRSIVDPALVLPEVAGALARRSGDLAFARAVIADMRQLPGLRLVTLTGPAAYRSAARAIDLGLRGADAVYVAVAERLGVPLVTWDQEQLARAAAVIQTRTP
jgi:predicted nucleic acid-binding protein